MTEHDLRRLLDDAADDRGRTPLSATRLARRSRRDRAVRRTAGVAGMAVGAVAIAAGIVGVVRSGHGPTARETPSSASCIAAVEVDGQLLVQTDLPLRLPELTGHLVPATIPDCNDTGGPPGDGKPTDVEEIAGVPTDVAVWWRGLLLVRDPRHVRDLPRDWYRPLRCDPGRPTTLVGRVSPDSVKGSRRDLPTSVGLTIDHTLPTDAAYERYRIQVRNTDQVFDLGVLDELRRAPDTIVEVDVACTGDAFVAEGVRLT